MGRERGDPGPADLDGDQREGRTVRVVLTERRRAVDGGGHQPGARAEAGVGKRRADVRALLAEATVVPSNPATSAAEKASTSRRISTARCRGGNRCKATTNASRIVSRCLDILRGARLGWCGSWTNQTEPQGNVTATSHDQLIVCIVRWEATNTLNSGEAEQYPVSSPR